MIYTGKTFENETPPISSTYRDLRNVEAHQFLISERKFFWQVRRNDNRLAGVIITIKSLMKS